MSMTFLLLLCVAAVFAGVLLFLIQERRDRAHRVRLRDEEKTIGDIRRDHERHHPDGSFGIVTPYRVITVPPDPELSRRKDSG